MRAVLDAIERVAAGDGRRADPRRDGHRQGAGGARHPRAGRARAAGPSWPSTARAMPEHAGRERAVRPRRGAFTGADRAAPGPFEQADGGTLFLDEIGELPLAAAGQAPARAPGGERRAAWAASEPLRGGRPRAAPPPTATCRPMVAEGRFREDLYYRLRRGRDRAAAAARARREDIAPARPPLPGRRRAARRPRRWRPRPSARSSPTPGRATSASWRNAVERATIFCRGVVIHARGSPRGGARRRAPAGEGDLLAWDPEDDFQTAKRKVVERFERAFSSRPCASTAATSRRPPASSACTGRTSSRSCTSWGSRRRASGGSRKWGRRKPPFLRMLIAMSDQLRDPELDQLVRSLNEQNPARETDLAFAPETSEPAGPLTLRTPAQAEVGEGEPLDRFLPSSSSRRRATCC